MRHVYDNAVLIYCVFLLAIGCFFLGFEVSTIQADVKIDHAQNIIKNCNQIIARETFK